MSKPQILIVHGGETFKTHKDYLDFLRNAKISLESQEKWKNKFFDEQLGNSFDIIRPQFPQPLNSEYDEWKIWFEKYFEFLNDGVILIGISLGSNFLVRYLSENNFPKRIKHVYLIAASFDDTLPDYNLVGGFADIQEDLSLLETQAGSLTLLFSKDDDVVPIEHMEKFKTKLPNAEYIVYESKNGHFQVEEFPEIVEMIRNDLS